MSPVLERHNKFRGQIDRESWDDHSTNDAFESAENGCRAAFIASMGNVAVVDFAGRLIGVNKGWLDFAMQFRGGLGKVGPGANYLEACRDAMRLSERDATAAMDGITRVLEGSIREFRLEYCCVIKPREHWFEMSVRPLCRPEGGAIITHLDIGRRRHAEQRAERLNQHLLELNKEAVLSQLAARFVHADNQGSAKLLQQLRAMLKMGRPLFSELAVNPLIQRAALLLRRLTAKEKVTISLQLGTSLPPVWGERRQLQQLVLNLMIHAFDAMRHSQCEDRQIVLATHKTEAGQAAILLRDGGRGIPPEQLKRVFESVFTTKTNGIGTGLALCRSIIEAHDGEISVANEPEKDVIIRVLLPACRPKPM